MNGYDFDAAFEELLNWESSFYNSILPTNDTPTLPKHKKARFMTPEPSPCTVSQSIDATPPPTHSISHGIPSPEKETSSLTATPALDWIALPPPATAVTSLTDNNMTTKKTPLKDRKRKRPTTVPSKPNATSIVSPTFPSLKTEYILNDSGKGFIKRTSYTLETVSKSARDKAIPKKKLCIVPEAPVFNKKLFIQTARSGEPDMMSILLKKFESCITIKDKQEAVVDAAVYGNESIIQLLFQDCKQVFTHRVLGDALYQARRLKRDKAATLLKSIFEQKVAERSLLLRATRDKDIQGIQTLLLDKETMISSYEIEKALQAACQLDDSSVFYYILSICYREVSSQVLDNCLTKATENKRLDLMLRLLPFSSFISDRVKGTCLRDCFVAQGFSEATQIMMSMFGDKIPSEEKAWILRRASETGNLETIMQMEQLGIATEDIGTFVKLATSNGHASIVEHLLERYGLLVSLADKKWSLELAFKKGYVHIYTTINASIQSFRHE